MSNSTNILGFPASQADLDRYYDEITAPEPPRSRPHIVPVPRMIDPALFYTGDIEGLDDEQRKALFETFFGDMPNAA